MNQGLKGYLGKNSQCPAESVSFQGLILRFEIQGISIRGQFAVIMHHSQAVVPPAAGTIERGTRLVDDHTHDTLITASRPRFRPIGELQIAMAARAPGKAFQANVYVFCFQRGRQMSRHDI